MVTRTKHEKVLVWVICVFSLTIKLGDIILT